MSSELPQVLEVSISPNDAPTPQEIASTGVAEWESFWIRLLWEYEEVSRELDPGYVMPESSRALLRARRQEGIEG